MANGREELVRRLKNLLEAAESDRRDWDFEAELAHELQATENWWVRKVEDKNFVRNSVRPLVGTI